MSNKRIKLARRSADYVTMNRRARSLCAVRWVDYRQAELDRGEGVGGSSGH